MIGKEELPQKKCPKCLNSSKRETRLALEHLSISMASINIRANGINERANA